MSCRGLLILSALIGAGCVDLSLPPQLQRNTIYPLGDADPAVFDAAVGDPVDANLPGAPTGAPDAAPSPPDLPLALGRRCATGADCQSGSCADGVCCGSACTALCYACNLPGNEGSCLPIPAGQDPGAEC